MNYRKLLIILLTSLLLFQESQARSYLSYAAITCAVMSTMGTIATIMNRYYKQSERNRVFTFAENIPQLNKNNVQIQFAITNRNSAGLRELLPVPKRSKYYDAKDHFSD